MPGWQFARHIGAHIGGGYATPDGGHVDQHPGPLAAEVGERRARSVHMAEEVRFHHCPENVRGYVLEAAVGDHSGAVDPDVEPAKALRRSSGELGDLAFVADVCRQPQHLGPEQVALPRDLLERRAGASGERQARAAAGERERGGTSDPARGAGDHDGTSHSRPGARSSATK